VPKRGAGGQLPGYSLQAASPDGRSADPRSWLGAQATRQLAVSRVIQTAEGEVSIRTGISSVGPGFLQVRGLTARAGMLPATPNDTLGGHASVVTSSFARQVWGEGEAVGQSFSVHGRHLTTVGVVDTGYGAVQFGAAPAVFIFDNRLLAVGSTLAVAFRVHDAASAKRLVADALREEFSAETRMEIVTGDELVQRDLEREQAGTWLFTGYGAVASMLALGGVLGLVSCTLRVKRREIGIRAALGASRGRLVRYCAALGGRPVGTGAFAGAIVSPLFASAAQSSFAGLLRIGTLTPVLAAAAVALAASTIAARQSGPVRACQEIGDAFGASRRPHGEARRPRIPSVFEGGATKPGGMDRRSKCVTYFLTGPYLHSAPGSPARQLTFDYR